MAGLKKAGESGKRHFNLAFAAVVSLLFAASLLVACTDILDLKKRVIEEVGQHNRIILDHEASTPAIAVSGSNVYVLYFDVVARNLMLLKSPDKGATWNDPYPVDSVSAYYSTSNNLAVDGNNVYVAYQRGDTVYFVELVDSGSSFTSAHATAISKMYASYPYGYECSVAFDMTNVYVVYSAGGAPAFSYADKDNFSFSTPVLIDSALGTNSGNRKPTSLYMDASGNIAVCYYDDTSGSQGLKVASFAYTDSLPKTVNRVTNNAVSEYGIGAQGGSMGVGAKPCFVAYFDTAASCLRMYEYFSYTYPPLMIGNLRTFVTVDSTSADVGRSPHCIYSGTTVYVLYCDKTNGKVKFAVGTKNPNNPPTVPPDYSYALYEVGNGGGKDLDCSLAYDSAGNILYACYYDATRSGLMVARSMDGGATWTW